VVPGAPEELLTWAQVKRLAAGIPKDLRQEILQLRRRWNQYQARYPRFVASAEAMGCGPLPRSGPLTARQAMYVEEEAFGASGGLEAWQANTADIETERVRLHDRALPLASSDDSTDLLELLAAEPAPATRSAIARHRKHRAACTNRRGRPRPPYRANGVAR